ncbi:filaggrin isoform X38 [Macrobrachium rosenbergii]|uniref:filaggrin isoform X38 n=1 Tax=Macrobrachium rosenbergii TaxID=79674 RepID=UPI0034D50725
MRDDVPRATQALGTPPQPQRRTRQGSPSVAPPTPSNPPSGDTTGGGGGGVGVDLSRSDSYSLSRGGKLVSSRPWSAQNHHQVVVNMHLVDIQKGSQQQQQQQPSSDSCRGVSSSGASSGASSSGDSSDSSDSDDDTSEDEYEVRTPARPLDHTHYTLPEEDEEEEAEGGGGGGEPKVEETESVNKPEAKERRGDERSDSEPDDNGGEATTLRDGRPTRPQEASGKDQGAANRSVDTDGGDCDSDDDEDDSESEETESTVRARQVGVGGNGVVAEEGEVEGEGEEGAGVGGALLDGASQPPVDEDHNDTLSTLSGDLSFDDRDVTSPPREHQHHHHHHLQAVPSVPEDPDAACQELGSSPSGTTPICHNRVNSSSQSPPGARKEPSQKENSHEELKEPVVPPRRTPPEGAGVRAGVFCISGYPRSNTDNPRSDLDSSSSSSYSQQMASSDLSYKRPLDDASLKFSKTHPADETGTTVSKDENPLEKTPLYVDSRQAKRFESPDRPSGAFPQEEERSGSGLGGKKVTPQQRSSKYASGSSSSRGPHLQGTWDQQGILPPPPRPQQQKPQQKLQQKPPQKQQRKEKQRTPPLLPNGARSSPSRQKHLSPEKEICRRARSQQQQEEEEEEEAEDTDRCSSCNGNNSVDNGYSSLPRSCPSPSPSCSSSHSYRPPSRSLLQEKEIQTSIRRDLYPPTPQHHSSKQTQQRQKLAQLDTQQQLQQLRRLQHSEQEQHQRSYQRQYSNRSDNSTSTVNSRSSSSSRDRVCGGGTGLRSPAHQSLTTTPTPLMPRLQTTPGLSGSASRLSGGNEGVGIGLGVGHSYGGLASTRLGGSYTALVSSAASSGYGSCAGGGGIGVGGVGVGGGGVGAAVVSSTRHEDSEDLSDVSSGATSEDSARRRRRRSAQPMKGEASVSGNEDFEWVRASPMLTGLLEGHVTRLATPPDHRGHSLRTSLATPPESGEESTGVSAHRHRQYTRPPPVPRPRTLEAGDLIPHRPIRDNLRDGLRDSRDGLRDRLYSPSRDLTGHRRSRDSSIERSGRDSSCERGSVSSLHQHNHHHHHHLSSRLSQHTCECPSCWCEEEEGGYDSCDERHHHHRHSYHEGLHHAHLHQLQSHHHGQPGTREASRERRSRGQGSGDSGRSSPCCCRHCHHLGSLSSLSSHDYCANTRLALPCTSKGSSLEDRVHRLEGDKDSLQLQVTVLSEQVEAQTEKIQDMESLLDQKKELLRKTEEQLQKEVMTRSSLETQRLELFSEISNLKLRQAAFERENAELRDKIRRVDHQVDHVKAQSVATGVGRSGSGRSITPAAASTPVHSILCSPDSPQPSHQLPTQMANSPSPSTISTLSTIPSSSPKISPAQPITVSPTASPLPVPVTSHDAREFLPPRTPPPNARRKIEQFGTIPRQREADLGGAATTGRTKGVMFGKGLHFLPFRVAGKRSTSAPNLAETEMQMIDDLPEGEYCPNVDGIAHPASSSPRMNALAGHRSPTTQHKTTGIKKIFTRLRRSSSGHLESDLGDGDFRRGGMRATASARLGWTSPNTIFKEPSEAFRSWNIETMEAWFGALGLSQYCAAVRTWSVAGRHMSQVTPQQLERDLGIRHPLHRKKIQLAISARVTGDQLNTPLARLDHAWVLRWLDDVGLPQYKDAFSEARIDGRVLNCLTYDDLAFLRLTNLLHVTSLKRGIQVLREHNFDPSVLKRRSLPEEDQRERSPSEVALWTNHRVMEWLRTVDLSEYAPNLRGSGVHGALMVYEVRFTSELLASLLSIPCGKTLLRRHLNTHFKELVGLSIVQEKRELEATAGYTPLTTTAKVKMPKKSQFSLKRKKTKSDLEFDDLLCPLDEKPPSGALQDKEKETNGDGRLC